MYIYLHDRLDLIDMSTTEQVFTVVVLVIIGRLFLCAIIIALYHIVRNKWSVNCRINRILRLFGGSINRPSSSHSPKSRKKSRSFFYRKVGKGRSFFRQKSRNSRNYLTWIRGVGSISILGLRVLEIMQYYIVDKKHKLFILCMFCHKICLFLK